MARRRRYLMAREFARSGTEEFAASQEERFAACPEAAQYTDEEVQEFLEAAQYFDSIDHKEMGKNLRKARIAYPAELAFDEYRLTWHVLRRWRDPAQRDALRQHALAPLHGMISRLKRRDDLQEALAHVDYYGPPTVMSMLRRYGLSDWVPRLEAAFSQEQVARNRALLLFGKLLMHRIFTEPEPQRQPSRWEQQKLAKRIHLRDVQMRFLRKSRYKLQRERKVLLGRLLETGRREYPELAGLAAELEQLRMERAEAERRHPEVLEEQARQFREAIAGLRAQMASSMQDYRDTVAVRRAWLPGRGGR